jgi:hypothetical protein
VAAFVGIRNRIVREAVRECDLFGQWAQRWRIVRTSNAYVFRDPLPCHEGRGASKFENPTGTLNQDILVSKQEVASTVDSLAGMDKGLLKALHRLGSAIAAHDSITVT